MKFQEIVIKIVKKKRWFWAKYINEQNSTFRKISEHDFSIAFEFGAVQRCVDIFVDLEKCWRMRVLDF